MASGVTKRCNQGNYMLHWLAAWSLVVDYFHQQANRALLGTLTAPGKKFISLKKFRPGIQKPCLEMQYVQQANTEGLGT